MLAADPSRKSTLWIYEIPVENPLLEFIRDKAPWRTQDTQGDAHDMADMGLETMGGETWGMTLRLKGFLRSTVRGMWWMCLGRG